MFLAEWYFSFLPLRDEKKVPKTINTIVGPCGTGIIHTSFLVVCEKRGKQSFGGGNKNLVGTNGPDIKHKVNVNGETDDDYNQVCCKNRLH